MNGICSRKRCLSVVIFLLLMTLGVSGWAQYPTKPITVIIGLGAGGGTDITTRALSDAASKILGQPIVIVNKPGGGTSIGLSALKNEKPDGYTIGTLGSSGIINAFIHKMPYDVVKDFTPIMSFSDSFGGVVVRADSPFKTFKDLVDYAKKNPGKIKYGTSGVGAHILAMEQLADEEKIKWVNIPFKSGGELMMGILGGHVDAVAAAPDFVPHTKSGKLRLLATYVHNRLPSFPDSPTFKELGYKVAAMRITTGALIGPRGIPHPIVDKLASAYKKAMDDPKFTTAMQNFENRPLYRGPEELGKDIEEWHDTFGKIVRKLNLTEK